MSNEQENPLVSVIIPTYKRPNMLGRAIDSVLHQTYDNIEIIVVDDNDEDSEYRKETEEFMDKYDDVDNLVYLKHKMNKNGSAARNTGIRTSKGEYIAFLDDDDEFLPHKIELQIEKLINSPNGYNAVYCNYLYYRDNKLINQSTNEASGDLTKELLLMETALAAGSTLLVRKNVLIQLKGFDEGFSRHQDWEFMIRYFRKNKLAIVNERLVKLHLDSTINRPNPEQLYKTKQYFLNTFKADIEKYKINVQNEIYKRQYLEIALSYLNNKKIRKGIMFLKTANDYSKLKTKDYLRSFMYIFNFLLLFKEKTFGLYFKLREKYK